MGVRLAFRIRDDFWIRRRLTRYRIGSNTLLQALRHALIAIQCEGDARLCGLLRHQPVVGVVLGKEEELIGVGQRPEEALVHHGIARELRYIGQRYLKAR